jgi:Protein of unknown function (DUF3095)
MTEAEPGFLAKIPVFDAFEDVVNLDHYRPLPDDWFLAVADVVSSGVAIQSGRYKMVNMAGASVITAVLNALGRHDYPFVFGGDGAVIALPGSGASAVREALAAVARWIAEDLALEMRVALVPVVDVRKAGRDVFVARLQSSPDLTFAMLAGGGAAWAEAQVKAGEYRIPAAPPGTRADLTGLSCRWNPIEARNGQIVSVIAVQRDPARAADFARLVADVVAVAGSRGDGGAPIEADRLKPSLSREGLEAETRALVAEGRQGMVRARLIFQYAMTRLSKATGLTIGGFNAKRYLRELARNTDFRKFDDGLKMTIDIDEAGLRKIEALLEDASARGVCDYGLHSQVSALLTCIVPSHRRRDHMHLVDGGGGGYAIAAQHMKAKIAARTAAVA